MKEMMEVMEVEDKKEIKDLIKVRKNIFSIIKETK